MEFELSSLTSTLQCAGYVLCRALVVITPRDASQRASGCMQQGGHVEVCHSRAPVGPATPSGSRCNQSAGQGRQTCPAKGKGSLTHREDPSKQQA